MYALSFYYSSNWWNKFLLINDVILWWKFNSDWFNCFFLHNWKGGCEFFLWEDEVINQTEWVGNNGGVLQERRDVDYDNAEIWKEIQSSLRTMWCALVFNWLVLFAFFLMYVFMINGYTYVWRDDLCMFGMKTMKSASFCMVNFCSLRNQILSSKGTFAKLSWN